MRSIVQRVGRLHRLAVFESAARLGSFSSAGRELGMTQPAVTRHIRSLERSVGHVLFVRSSNRSEPTDAGERLFRAISSAFDVIEDNLVAIDASSETFVLASGPGLAQQLLVPALEELQLAAGSADLRLWVFDNERELPPSGHDAVARVGSGEWTGIQSSLLFPELVVPVACPDLARRFNGPDTKPEELLDTTLVHMDNGDRQWLSWGQWFGSFDLERPAEEKRVVLNHYPLVLQQALAGKGVALGWRYLIEGLLASGDLIRVGPELSTGKGFHLTWQDSVQSERHERLAEAIRGARPQLATTPSGVDG